MHVLERYLKESETTQAAFALDLGVSQGLISQWINGITPITPKRARRIETITKGKVSRYQLCPEIFGNPPKSS